jgi:hypothetical protein
MKNIFHGAKFIISLPVSPDLLLGDSVSGIARRLWSTNQDLSPLDIILPWFSYITWGEK